MQTNDEVNNDGGAPVELPGSLHEFICAQLNKSAHDDNGVIDTKKEEDRILESIAGRELENPVFKKYSDEEAKRIAIRSARRGILISGKNALFPEITTDGLTMQFSFAPRSRIKLSGGVNKRCSHLNKFDLRDILSEKLEKVKAATDEYRRLQRAVEELCLAIGDGMLGDVMNADGLVELQTKAESA